MHEADTTIEELHFYISHRGKCAKPVRPRYRANHDPWYREPKKGRYAPDDRRLKAKRACRGCPVINDCLTVALALEAEAGASWGVWGATIPADRAKMLAERGQVGVVVDEDGGEEVVGLDMAG
ncbi:WhiB family transcriptional regulator [Saccharopolyspora sp. ID03-671]|uniref:WhiB family transcriptional regulator n=1 Tax=Saccharopolyspora sp. ID03-671 TaxID=3073066 RepID=UPI00325018C5